MISLEIEIRRLARAGYGWEDIIRILKIERTHSSQNWVKDLVFEDYRIARRRRLTG
jgi:hypothetical protein